MKRETLIVTSLLAASFALSLGSSAFNCPAPRSPDNGINFIFEDGQVVMFRCHPGFALVGKAKSTCINNQWDSTTPECRSVDPEDDSNNALEEAPISVFDSQDNATEGPSRGLFTWGGETLYGVGPRRLPLINGLWKPSQADSVLSIGSELKHPIMKYGIKKPKNKKDKYGGNSSLSPNSNGKELIKQEVGIAEIRHKQQQEVRRLRPTVRNDHMTWRQQQIKEARRGPTIFYAGSRSASAYRGGQSLNEEREDIPSTSDPDPVAPAPPTASRPTTPIRRHRQSDPALDEMRRRQIEQTLSSRIHSGQHTTEKAGLIEEARRRQYAFVQSIRSGKVTESTRPRLTIVAPPLTATVDGKTQVERAMAVRADAEQPSRGVSRLFFDNRHLFSQEKAAQVDATVRQFLTPDTIHLTTDESTSHLPPYRATVRVDANVRESVTPDGLPYYLTTEQSRPTLLPPPSRRQPLNLPPIVRNSDKSGQTQEALYQQYLQAEHLRRILDYETAALQSANRRAHSSLPDPNIRTLIEQINLQDGLRQADVELLAQLSPDLQANYLHEILLSRGKEASESHLAEDFMRRYNLNRVAG